MKRLLSLILFLSVPLIIFSQDKIILRQGQTKIQIISQDINHIDLTVELGEISLTQTKADNKIYWKLDGDGLTEALGNGEPMLPQIIKLIQIPLGANVNIAITDEKSDIIRLSNYGITDKLLPAHASLRKDNQPKKFDEDPRIYNQDKFYRPDNIVKSQTLGIMRNLRYGMLSITPFEYNPVENLLKIYTKITIHISFSNPDIAMTEALYKKYTVAGFGVEKYTINKLFTKKSVGVPSSFPLTYVIVSPAEFQSSKKLQEFIQWKKKQGYNIITGYTGVDLGTTKDDIKAWLEDLYNNPPEGYNPPAYVLFLGDISNMPAWVDNTVNDNPYTDLFYVEYTGDHRPEVDWGRISAEDTTELYNALKKIIYYERDQFASDYSHLKQALMVPGDDESFEDKWGNGQIRYGVTYYFNSAHNIYSHTFYQDPEDNGVPGGNDAVHDSIIANVNNGLGYANYTAHCSPDGWYKPSFSVSDLATLTNAGKYGVWVANCCQSNKFDEQDAFSEEALYAPEKGAAAYIGGSQYTYWDEDYWWGVGLTSSITEDPSYSESGRGAYDAMFHDQSNEVNSPQTWALACRQVIDAGNLAVDQSSSSLKNYYWTIYQVMGDPSMTTKIGTPATTVLNLDNMVVSTNKITGTTLPYTFVSVTQDGELIGAGISDQNGFIDITTVKPIPIGYLDVVAYGQNKTTVIKSIPAYVPDQPYLIVTDVAPDTLRYNTTASISLTIGNINDSYSATNVYVKVESEDPNVQVLSDSLYIGDFAAGDTVVFPDTLSLKTIYPTDKELALLRFKIYGTYNDSVYSWESYQRFVLRAPVLKITQISVADPNNNGYSDLGQTDSIIVSITNTGGAAANNITATLTTDNTDLIIPQPSVNFDLNIGDTVTLKIPFDVPADAIEGLKTAFKVTAQLYTYSTTDSIMQWIGQPLDLAIGDGTTEVLYPLYDYYENEKTDFLYKMSYFGGAKLISTIGFQIEAGDPWTFKNFKILMKETDLDQLSGYADMSDATVVYSTDELAFPGNLDNDYFMLDITPFFYSAEKNLLVEVVWGDNGTYQSLGAIIKSYGTTMDYTSVAYGYDDNTTPPELRETSTIIANTKFEFQAFGHTFIKADNYTDTVEHDMTVYIPVTVRNYGQDTAFDKSLTLTCDNDQIEIINNTFNIDTLQPNSAITIDTAFEVKIGSLANNEKIVFTVASEDIASTINYVVKAPELKVAGTALLSENSKYIENNEQAVLEVKVTNTGLDTAFNVSISSSSNSDNLQATADNQSINILPGDTAIFNIDLKAGEIDNSEKIKIDLNLLTDNYSFDDSAFVWLNIPEETVIGQIKYFTDKYPFYQYYENEKTQIVFRNYEFDTLPISIKSMGLYIQTIENSQTLIPLQNFKINIFKTDMDQVVNSYLSTISEPVTVYYSPSYIIPSTGWIYFDFKEPFIYDGQGNLAVEIVWGDNGRNTVDDIIVAADSTEVPTVGYGYAYSQTPPNYSTSSYLRPVTYFSYDLNPDNPNGEITILVYPNPASENVNIGSNNTLNKVQLFSIDGQLLRTWNPYSTRLSFSVKNLSKGIYLIKVETDNGSTTQKVIVN